ncbi:MAG: hypothetical protein JOZ52_12155 [Acidobacteria bacterium]|nr:hypothetical protein [Acidobacteriota bacterium]
MRRIYFSCAFALMLLLVASSMTLHASGDTTTKSKEPKLKKGYGRMDVKTSPAGYPLLVDGKDYGVTYNPAQSIDVPAGPHTVEVLFPDRRWTQQVNIVAGKRNCICLNYVKHVITRPCPYPVSVSAPSVVDEGDVITFSSDVAYGGQSALNYTWTVSPPSARIMSGAGTNSITVDSTGLGKQKVTAILVVDDGSGDAACRQMAQATVDITAPPPPLVPPHKFDEFPSVAFDDDKARLDNLAIELQNSPDATGYLFVYSGKTSRVGQADRLGARALDYLTKTRGIDSQRIVVVNGGYRETDYYEFWTVPQGAQPPQPSPTVDASEVRPAPERPARRTSRRTGRRR